MPGNDPRSDRQLCGTGELHQRGVGANSSPGDGASALVRATRLSIAVKVDRGELSPEDAGAQLAVVGFQAQQQQAAPNAARAAAAAQLLGATRPAPLEFHPMQVNSGWSASCQTIGTQTYCSGR